MRKFSSLREFFKTIDPIQQGGSTIAPEPVVPKTVLMGTATINFLALALPITILQVYDRVLPNSAFGTLNALILGLAAVILIDIFLKHARASVSNWQGAAYSHRTSIRAMKEILSVPTAQKNRVSVSEYLDRLGSVNAVGDFIASPSRLIKVDALFIPLFGILIGVIGGWLVFVPLCLFVVFGILSFNRTKKLRTAIAEREKTDARKTDFVIETLDAISTVKSLAMEPSLMRRFERLQLASSDIVRRTITLTSAAQTYASAFASLSTIFIVGIGATLVIHDQLTIGELACCMLLSSQMIQPLGKILSAWNEVQLVEHNRSNVDSIFESDAEIDIQRPPSRPRRFS